MVFEISDSIAKAYPNLRLAVVVASDLDNQGSSSELIEVGNAARERFRERIAASGLSTQRNIVAWRETYRSFGVNPKKKPPTFEARCEKSLEHGEIFRYSKAVNIYLAAELEFLLPVGGYDLARVSDRHVLLRHSVGGENFVPIGGEESSPQKTNPGEVVYSDIARVLTRRWNYKDCDAAKITEQSREIALFSEAANDGISNEDIQGTAARIQALLLKFCGGRAKVHFLEATKGTRWELSAD